MSKELLGILRFRGEKQVSGAGCADDVIEIGVEHGDRADLLTIETKAGSDQCFGLTLDREAALELHALIGRAIGKMLRPVPPARFKVGDFVQVVGRGDNLDGQVGVVQYTSIDPGRWLYYVKFTQFGRDVMMLEESLQPWHATGVPS